ncbi:MAG: M48 family metallopeptidase [Pseudomonadota bacterium]
MLAALCALPAHAQGSYLRQDDFRVATIGYRLATAAPELCAKPGPVSGILLHHLAEYGRADRPGLIAQGLDRGPAVLAVVAGSPGESAGLVAGDVLLAVNGSPFASPAAIAANRDSEVWRPLVEASETMLQDQLARGPVALSVLRQGRTLSLTLAPRTGCPLRIRLARSSQKTAVAAGPYVVVSTGLLAVAANDDELAFTIAHELAHVVLGHGQWLREQRVPRGMMRGFGRNGARVRETEAAADRLGGLLTLAARYDLARGALILDRLPPEIGFGVFKTHDSDGERIRALRALAAEHPAPTQ